MGKKRSPAKGAAIWWLLTVCIASLFLWILWKNSQTPTPTTRPAPTTTTNALNLARATNLLHWLNTNFIAPTNLATKPTVPPPASNRLATNRFPTPTTNITLRASSPAVLSVTSATSVLIPQTNRPPIASVPTPAPAEYPVRTILEAQIALARQAISSGPIDGRVGSQTRAALRAFQIQNDLPETGDLDPATRAALTIAEPIFTYDIVTPLDLARLRPVPSTWLEKSGQETLEYETILELIAERHQASHNLIKFLNPGINWTNAITPFTQIKVPHVPRPTPRRRAAYIRIALAAKTLQAFDDDHNLLAHFPCSIAARVEKRPIGQLTVVTGAEDPNYTFDPAVFPESEEARHIDRKLIIPPGPNNPVGTAWITLDKPGYGIHGTPRPDQVGRTESHGCFRLANWNAEYLLKIVNAGTPVYVDP